MERNKIYNEDCLNGLAWMPDESVDCCVTSPPYYGLRDYGMDAQIGLEGTPEEYVAKMVEVFTEVKRVLKKDGTLFLNLGDSYFGSSTTGGTKSIQGTAKRKGAMFSKKDAQRAVSCDTSDKVPVDYPANDCLCGSLCDGCRKAYQIGKSHRDCLRDPKPASLSSLPNLGHKEFVNGHLPTSDSIDPEVRILNATQDFGSLIDREAGQLLSSQESMPVESSLQQSENFHQSDSFSSCLLCGCSFQHLVRVSDHSSACTCGIKENDHPLFQSNSGISSSHKAYRKDTNIQPISTLKPKDLIGIPWMVAFALRSSGWYLRQDIIWHKPNPMPESVTDRCTKSHEYIFLLSKSGKYYYDYEAIKQENTEGSLLRYSGKTEKPFTQKYEKIMALSDRLKSNGHHKLGDNGANKRSVWTVTTRPYSEAHFATFPERLITDCIKAGCPEDGIILDPFMGAGTTALVARKLNRNFIGFELNPEYIKIANTRLQNELGMFL